MISFIVIGKNEGWRLTKCLTSIYTVINEDNITDYEIIFVDSKSTDDSVERALSFGEVSVFEITGECNAAIARNIGALEAKGDILFFIDGDMEILSGLLPKVIDENGNLTYPFLSGIFEDYIYDENWKFTEVERRYKLSESMPDSYESTTGGLFIINKELWKSAGGMDSRLVRSQDLDLGLRLTKIGTPLLRKPILLALHHTISYLNNNRKNIYASSAAYTALLARKHFFNKAYLSIFVRSQYSAISLFISILGMVFISPLFIIFYVLTLMLKAYKFSSKSSQYFIDAMWIISTRDIHFLKSFLFEYPVAKKMEYIKKK